MLADKNRAVLGATMRIHRPAPNVIAFYDGRIPGVRAWSEAANWLDDGAYELGVASYAIVDGDEALVYDTHISCPHAQIVRRTLAGLGVRRFTVLLSHSHRDHVAGNAVFGDCEILAHPLTAELLASKREMIENGDPPIRPLVMPTRLVADGETVRVGAVTATIRHFDIHSCDGTALVLAGGRLLLAGDMLEDPITYVAEPDRLTIHLEHLDRLAALGVEKILPNHGAEARIAAGGFGPELIDATRRYVEHLQRCRTDPSLAAMPLREVIADDLRNGVVGFFGPYERVHARNVAAVTEARR